VAAVLLLQNAAVGVAAPSDANPLEGRLLQHSTGTFYVYHGGFKFPVQVADLGDEVIQAIPTASMNQWANLFIDTRPVTPAGASQHAPAGEYTPALPGQPVPFPGYS